MDWWIIGIVRRLGGQGALDNARTEIETRRFQLQQADAAARRVAMLPRPTPRPLPGHKSA